METFSLIQIVFQLELIIFLIKIKIKLIKSRTIKKYVNACGVMGDGTSFFLHLIFQ